MGVGLARGGAFKKRPKLFQVRDSITSGPLPSRPWRYQQYCWPVC